MVADQSLSDFPVWIWPYINVASLARVKFQAEHVIAQGIPTPQPARLAHLVAILSATQTKRFVAEIPDIKIREQLGLAADAALSHAIDDCGNGKRKPWPRPPRAAELLQIAGDLAIVAAEIEDEFMSDELARTVSILSDRAMDALKVNV